MSKLYVKATTDAVKTAKTARGHREAEAQIAWNFHGGNTPAGFIILSAVHTGHAVRFTIEQMRDGKYTILKTWLVEDNPSSLSS